MRFEAAAEGEGGCGGWQSFCALLAAERGARLLHATRVLNRHLGAVHEAAAVAVAGALSTAGPGAASAAAAHAASPGCGADQDRPFTAGDYGGSAHWSSSDDGEEEEDGVLSEGWESESGDDLDEAEAHQLADPTRALTAALRAAGAGASATPVFLFLGRSAWRWTDVAEEGFPRALAAQAGVRLHTCPLAAMAELPSGSSAGAVPHQLLLVRVCPGVVRLAGGDGAAPCDAVIDAQAMGTDAAVWCAQPQCLDSLGVLKCSDTPPQLRAGPASRPRCCCPSICCTSSTARMSSRTRCCEGTPGLRACRPPCGPHCGRSHRCCCLRLPLRHSPPQRRRWRWRRWM